MKTLPIKALRKIRKSKNFKKLNKKYGSFHSDPTGGYLQGSRVEMDIPSLAKAQARLNKFMKG